MSAVVYKFAQGETTALAEKRQVRCVISSPALDRQGDRVQQAGISTDNFMKTGGTVLWQHDSDTPIARCIAIGIEAGKLTATCQFPPPEASPRASEIYSLILAKVISSTSIGFIGHEFEPLNNKEPWAGRNYTSVELVEFSFVSAPANVDAVIVSRSNGRRSADPSSVEDHAHALLDIFAKSKKSLAAAKASHGKTVSALAEMAGHLGDLKSHVDALAAAGFRPGDDDGDDNDELSMTPDQRKAALAALDGPPEIRATGGGHLAMDVLNSELERLRRFWESPI